MNFIIQDDSHSFVAMDKDVVAVLPEFNDGKIQTKPRSITLFRIQLFNNINCLIEKLGQIQSLLQACHILFHHRELVIIRTIQNIIAFHNVGAIVSSSCVNCVMSRPTNV